MCRHHRRVWGEANGQTMPTNLKRGQKCIVASYGDDGEVVFDWHCSSRESRMPGPNQPGTNVRVF
jgi:hypothetical protein